MCANFSGVTLKKLNFFSILIVLIFTIISASKAYAIDSLYSAKIVVEDRSDAEWRRGVADALERVLIKVSGNPGINTLPKVNDLVASNDEMVQQFSYFNNNGSLTLSVNFDIEKVDSILKKSGQLIWGANRPTTLVWFVNDSGSNGLFITSQDKDARVFKDFGASRGVELYFPVNDLSYSELAQIDIDSDKSSKMLKEISKKYRVDQILFGKRDIGADGGYSWKLIAQDADYSWHYENQEFEDVVKSALDHLVHDMVANSAVYQEESLEEQLKLGVSNIRSLNNYQALLNYFNKSPVVGSISVAKVENDLVVLDIAAKGGGIALSSYIQNNSGLILPINDPNAYDGLDMVYKWVSR